MARLPRLVVPGLLHLGVQRVLSGRSLCRDDADRDALLAALHEAAALHRVALHAWAMGDDALTWLVTPPDEGALSLFVQDFGRRYVSAYNRRHGGSGTLWDGRFRCGVVEAGSVALEALCWVDGQPGLTTAPQRAGGKRDPRLVDPPEYWQQGNTPFEREAAWRALLAQGLPAARAQALRAAASGGWALGSDDFVAGLAQRLGRAVTPRPRGRPRAQRL